MKKGVWLSVIAGAAAVAGAAVAVSAFLKKKSRALSDQLDYEPEDDFEDIEVTEVTADDVLVDEEIADEAAAEDELVAEETLDEAPEQGSEAL